MKIELNWLRSCFKQFYITWRYAVDAMVSFCHLRLTSGSITLLAMAPLTNIAVALMLDASFGHKLNNCVMMGGNYNMGVFESQPATIISLLHLAKFH